jgi:2-dehydropantoate 2-reductase
MVAGEPYRQDKFDVAILSCKSYDIPTAVDAIAPALGPHSIVLPLLNGLAHLDRLDAQFGRAKVLGGMAHLGLTLTPEGDILHLNDIHRLFMGSRSEPVSPWLDPLGALLSKCDIEFHWSAQIEADMWDKFIFLCTLAGVTCSMRASIGDVLTADYGKALITGMFEECLSVARHCGHVMQPAQRQTYQGLLTQAGSTNMASMLRDIERGGPTEADHIMGDMVIRGKAHHVSTPFLEMAYLHCQAYAARRAR